jgi:Transglutaminase-like enzymes, putative cysteine proteases
MIYKRLRHFFILTLAIGFGACAPRIQQKQTNMARLENLLATGEFKKLTMACDSAKANQNLTEKQVRLLDSLVEVGRRVRLDFRLSEADVKIQLKKYLPDLDSASLQKWERTRTLEMRRIDGEKRYFGNAVPNLFRLDDNARSYKEKVDGKKVDSLDIFCLAHTQKVIEATKQSGQTALPVKIKLSYLVDVDVNAVPDGETIKCWLPFPREGNARQKNVRLISSEPDNAVVADNSNLQSSVYLERKAEKDKPTFFRIDFEVEASAQYFDLKPEQIKPYNKESELYKEFTAERAPQIVFTPEIRNLASRILGSESNPLLKVRKLYNWINDSVRWASALEYSTFTNIPHYVLANHHGDCGMQTLLFMTLARSQGIPVKWQSGWMLHPRNVNLHDWCEVYYEGVGWVPLDQSFGLQNSDNEKVRNFYQTGIDAYRLIVNDDFSQPFSPAKKFMRSEPYDFQRGELEWKGGNLYFDKWSWHMEAEYNQ